MKRYYAILIAIIIALISPAAAAPSPERLPGAPGDAAIGAREETIYVDMKHDGSVNEVLAVIRLRVDGAGNYMDYGNFSSVVNLSNGLAPSIVPGEGAFWSFPEAHPGFAYQCALVNPVLPFELILDYTLNGRAAPPESLAGASGEVGIHVEVRRPADSGEYFERQFMIQLQFTFPADSCQGVEANGPAPVLAGGSRILSLACLPGQNLSSDITIDTTDFSMDRISLSMVPYDIASIIADNMPELDLSELSDGLDGFADGLDTLANGSHKLKAGLSDNAGGMDTLAESASELKTAAAQLSLGMSQVNTAMTQYETLFTEYITGGDQFIRLFRSLVDGSVKLSSGISQLSYGLEAAADGAGKLPDGMQGLLDGQEELAAAFEAIRGALDEAASGIVPDIGAPPPPVSFINGSGDISSVQFVGNLPAISKPAEQRLPPQEEVKSSFWERLAGLFRNS